MKVVLLYLCVSAIVMEVTAGYHKEFGIPLAAKITTEEVEVFATGPNVKSAKIIGGRAVHVRTHPYMVGLHIEFENDTSVCSASLVSADHLLTAAHCCVSDDRVTEPIKIVAVLGTHYLYHGGTRILAKKAAVHPDYHSVDTSGEYDIAVVYLSKRVKFSKDIKPISIPKPWELPDSDYIWGYATAVGYGRTSGEIPLTTAAHLRHVQLLVVPVDVCHNAYGWKAAGDYICTSGYGGVGVCYGDSGGPLVYEKNRRKFIIGISSLTAEGCQIGRPSGFTKVTNFYSFLKKHVQF